jgi:hypothetical protein
MWLRLPAVCPKIAENRQTKCRRLPAVCDINLIYKHLHQSAETLLHISSGTLSLYVVTTLRSRHYLFRSYPDRVGWECKLISNFFPPYLKQDFARPKLLLV